MSFPELDLARKEKRHELVLSGKEVEEKFAAEGGVPPELFQLVSLNFLEISRAGLSHISPSVANLSGLVRLNLRENSLRSIPEEIGRLDKLKFLDLSFNSLERVPDSISGLKALQVLNLGQNQLSLVPSLSGSLTLIELNVGGNRLEEIPEFLLQPSATQLTYFSTLNLDGNQISEIPPEIAALPALKLLSLEQNQISSVPAELADGPKLKEIKLDGNPLKDKRLAKLIKDSHTKPQKILEYIRSHCVKSGSADANQKDGKKRKNKNKAALDTSDEDQDEISIAPSASAFQLTLDDEAIQIRPHLICCIVRDLNLSGNALKKFLVVQNKLHDDPKLCAKRSAATIATHDLAKVKAPLKYSAAKPEDLRILPLRSTKVETGAQLLEKLVEEAEAVRRKEKRNEFSGVHKYLNLVRPLPLFPCLLDAEGNVISFPPITNSDLTKMSESTKDLLIEVSSAGTQKKCKDVMEALLVEMLKAGLGSAAEEAEQKKLCVQQVKILNGSGDVHATFPDKNDLNALGNIRVVRSK